MEGIVEMVMRDGGEGGGVFPGRWWRYGGTLTTDSASPAEVMGGVERSTARSSKAASRSERLCSFTKDTDRGVPISCCMPGCSTCCCEAGVAPTDGDEDGSCSATAVRMAAASARSRRSDAMMLTMMPGGCCGLAGWFASCPPPGTCVAGVADAELSSNCRMGALLARSETLICVAASIEAVRRAARREGGTRGC